MAGEWLECQKRIDAYVDEQVGAAPGARGLASLEAFTQHPALQSLGCADQRGPRRLLSPSLTGQTGSADADGRVGQVTFGVVEDREAGLLC